MKDGAWYRKLFLGLLLLALFFILYFKPKSEEIKTLRAERQRDEQTLLQLQGKKIHMNKIKSELKKMTVTLEELEKIIPQKEEMSSILRKIQQLAYNTQLTINKFIPKDLINREFYSEKPINIEVTGSYHNLALFYNQLSRFSRLFNIEDFVIKSLPVQTETSTILANSTAKTYIFHSTPPVKEENQNSKRNTK